MCSVIFNSIKRLSLLLPLLALTLAAVLGAGTVRAQSPDCIRDVQGADDEPGQKDLNRFCDTLGNDSPFELTVRWNLDDTAWSGSNTGDACALFDTDGDHLANFALCVTVIGGPPAVLKSGSPKLYSCTDTRPDRCTGSVPIASFSSTCAIDSDPVDKQDPFSHSGNVCKNTPGCRTTDTVVTCQLESNDLPGTETCVSNRCSNIPTQFCLGSGDCIPITDVCSYPSEQPNSDPSDCVITPTGQDPCQGVNCSAFNTPCATASCNPNNGQCDILTPKPSTTPCTGTSNGGACDGTDHCSGTANTCVDGFLSATTTCRNSAGQCDVAESCTGSSGACPANGFQPATTTCVGTSNGGGCDGTDSCNGSGACVDGFQAATTICRGSAGQCDVAESCTGSSGACPANGFQPATTTCVGTSNGDACDGTDSCNGSGACVDGFKSTSNVCRASAGPCDVAESCTGSSGACPVDGFQSATTICRTSAGQCDVAESCTGTSSACPANGFQPSTTTCVGTSNSGACDGTDSCDGTGACVEGFKSATTICRTSAGQCDVAESCTGTSSACPANGFQSATTTCVGTSNGGACDGTDSCNGSGACVDGFQAGTTICRASAGQCDVAESCTGSSGGCPADGFVAANTACDDGNACTLADACNGSGVCVGGGARNCDDANECTIDDCDPSTGCFSTNAGAVPCSDQDACTIDDVCVSGQCVGGNGPSSDPGCVEDTAGADDDVGQKDLTQFCQSPGGGACSGTILTWNWDDTVWTGNNTGDACALYDTNHNGSANFALCVTVGGSPAGQLANSPRLYSCTDAKPFNCTGSALVSPRLSRCDVIPLVADPFGPTGRKQNKCSGANCLSKDTQAQCCVNAAELPTTAELIDVCSYPSQSPSSDPSECVKTVFCTTDANCVISNDEGTCQGHCVSVAGVTQCVYN